MKKTLLPLLGFFCFCVAATAQFKSGDVLLGGNLGFSNSNTTANPNNTTATKGTNIYISPTIGFFKTDKTLYSVGVIYEHTSSDYAISNVGTQHNTGNSYGINFSKQHFIPIAKNFYFTIGGGITALYTDNKNTYYQTNTYETNKGGQFSVGLQPGVSYKITKRLLFDLYIPNIIYANYNTGTYHYFTANGTDTKATNNSFNIGTNLNSNLWYNLTFGIRFLLGKKAK